MAGKILPQFMGEVVEFLKRVELDIEQRDALLAASKKVMAHFIANGSGDLECIRELEAAVEKAAVEKAEAK